tara:strand:- start:617 stop:1681 length:1065 start_codon:yes stop_codon:yes gene_type:complete
MIASRENVLIALSNVIEPDLKKDIVTLNLVEKITIGESEILIEVNISNPALHAKKRMTEAIKFNLKRAFGDAYNYTCTLNVEKKINQIKKEREVLPNVKKIIAVASGKGGVGKSTVTANLACGLAKKGYSVGVVDADIYGPSMPTMFGAEDDRPGSLTIDGKKKMTPIEAFGVKMLSIGFFSNGDNAIAWRGPMASRALQQLFLDVHWGALDFLLIDLPPGTGDIHLSLVQNIPLDGAIMVSTPQNIALIDAKKGINMFKLDTINVPIIGLVENMSWFTPEELPNNKYYLFGRDGAQNLAKGLNIPFLGCIPLVQSIRESGDSGNPSVIQEGTYAERYFEQLVCTFVENVNPKS